MKRIVFKITFFVLCLILTGIVPKSVFARQSDNITGVNLACQWDTKDEFLQDVKSLVKPGGWMVIMATPGDAERVQELLDKKPGVNLIIRVDKMKQSYTPADAAAWVATLGKLKTDQKIFVMPWNEPNQSPSAGSTEWIEAEDLSGQPHQVVAQKVKDYTEWFGKYLQTSGLKDSGRAFLLSPAFNQSHPNFKNFIQDLGGGGYFDQFDGIATNIYDYRASRAAGPLQHDGADVNAIEYRELFQSVGFDDNSKPIFLTEAGVQIAGEGVVYEDDLISETIGAAANAKWSSDTNFNMFAVFSYDPEHEDNWDIFHAPSTQAVYANIAGSGGAVISGGNPPDSFNDWVSQKVSSGEIVACPDEVGYASTPELCLGGCGFYYQKRRVIQTDETDKVVADPVILYHDEKLKNETNLPGGSTPPPLPAHQKKTVTRGGIFENFKGLVIPFAKPLAQYLAGPYLYEGPSVIKTTNKLALSSEGGYRLWLTGPLVNSLPRKIQDDLRYRYWKNCRDGYFIPQECLVVDKNNRPFLISRIPKPPNKDDLTHPDNTHWRSQYLELWDQVPLVDNPVTKAGSSNQDPEDKAIKIECCPEQEKRSSNIITETPYIYGLDKIAEILNKAWTPKVVQEIALLQDQNSGTGQTLGCYQEPAGVCSPEKITNDSCLRLGVGLPITIKSADDYDPRVAFSGPTEVLECDWHLQGSQTLCNFSVSPPICTYTYTCEGKLEPDFNNKPVRPRVAYPYLSQIYQNLSGPNGLFRAQLIANQAVNWDSNSFGLGKWDAYTESPLNYCYRPATPDPNDPLTSLFPPTMAKNGEIRQYDAFANPPPPATCPGGTSGLSVYPPYLGGVINAADAIIYSLQLSNSGSIP